jgi:hypothetical protein
VGGERCGHLSRLRCLLPYPTRPRPHLRPLTHQRILSVTIPQSGPGCCRIDSTSKGSGGAAMIQTKTLTLPNNNRTSQSIKKGERLPPVCDNQRSVIPDANSSLSLVFPL